MAKDFKYIKKEPLPGRKFRYYYGDQKGQDWRRTLKDDNPVEVEKNDRVTGQWVSAFNAIFDNSSKVSVNKFASNSRVSKGRKKVSGLVNVNRVYNAKTQQTQKSKEDYKKSLEELETKTKEQKENTEKYYRNLYEREKDSYRKQLELKYGDNQSMVETELSKYSASLWNTVYKPLVDRTTKNIDDNSQYLMRTLKRLSKGN